MLLLLHEGMQAWDTARVLGFSGGVQPAGHHMVLVMHYVGALRPMLHLAAAAAAAGKQVSSIDSA
jgi:hypothetical protein